MALLAFLRKNNKVLLAVGGLILICVSVLLLNRKIETEETERVLNQSQEVSTAEPKPTEISKPTTESSYAEIPKSSAEPIPTEVPEPIPTEEPKTVLSEEYERVYEGINVFTSLSSTSYLKYKDLWADLYMRRLQDDSGEFIELSVWYEGEELWHTRKENEINPNYLFWSAEYSDNLTLNQRKSYYVVELDGNVFLMDYSVETVSNMVTLYYKVFGISNSFSKYGTGTSVPYDADSISFYLVKDSDVTSEVSFPVEQMVAFANTVQGYMEKGQLVASTLHDEFEFGNLAERDNPISLYLYDIFPWIQEMTKQYGIDMLGMQSTEDLLRVLQNALPTEDSVIMPNMADDGSYFITGDYYSHNDRSYLVVRMNEGGSYEGRLWIDNLLFFDFIGNYDNGILTITEVPKYSDDIPYELEITFQSGVAIATITVAEGGTVSVGDTFVFDRNEKPEEFEYLKKADNG